MRSIYRFSRNPCGGVHLVIGTGGERNIHESDRTCEA